MTERIATHLNQILLGVIGVLLTGTLAVTGCSVNQATRALELSNENKLNIAVQAARSEDDHYRLIRIEAKLDSLTGGR